MYKTFKDRGTDMKKIIFAYLVFCLSTTAFAGGVLACDDYGHMCVIPGNYNCVLIPPVHGCSNEELTELLAPRLQNVDAEMSTQGWNPECYDKGPLCDK